MRWELCLWLLCHSVNAQTQEGPDVIEPECRDRCPDAEVPCLGSTCQTLLEEGANCSDQFCLDCPWAGFCAGECGVCDKFNVLMDVEVFLLSNPQFGTANIGNGVIQRQGDFIELETSAENNISIAIGRQYSISNLQFAFVRFTPQVYRRGYYRVWAFVPVRPESLTSEFPAPESATVSIVDFEGSYTSNNWNQVTQVGQWSQLVSTEGRSEFLFNFGTDLTSSQVTIFVDDPTKYTIFDALYFEKTGDWCELELDSRLAMCISDGCFDSPVSTDCCDIIREWTFACDDFPLYTCATEDPLDECPTPMSNFTSSSCSYLPESVWILYTDFCELDCPEDYFVGNRQCNLCSTSEELNCQPGQELIECGPEANAFCNDFSEQNGDPCQTCTSEIPECVSAPNSQTENEELGVCDLAQNLKCHKCPVVFPPTGKACFANLTCAYSAQVCSEDCGILGKEISHFNQRSECDLPKREFVSEDAGYQCSCAETRYLAGIVVELASVESALTSEVWENEQSVNAAVYQALSSAAGLLGVSGLLSCTDSVGRIPTDCFKLRDHYDRMIPSVRQEIVERNVTVTEQATDGAGNLAFESVVQNGETVDVPVMVAIQVPVLDANGVQATTTEEVQIVDSAGNPILDDGGNPVFENVTRPMFQDLVELRNVTIDININITHLVLDLFVITPTREDAKIVQDTYPLLNVPFENAAGELLVETINVEFVISGIQIVVQNFTFTSSIEIEKLGSNALHFTGENLQHVEVPTFFRCALGLTTIQTRDVNIAALGFQDCTTEGLLSRRTDFTVALWVKTQSESGPLVAQRDIECAQTVAYGSFFIQIRGGLIAVETTSSGRASWGGRSTDGISDGRWHLVVVVQTGTGGTMYIDAVQSPNTPNYLNADNDGGRAVLSCPSVYLGGDPVTQTTLTGTIDEFAMWNRALSRSEITSMLNTGTSASFSVRLLVHYKFDTGFEGTYDGVRKAGHATVVPHAQVELPTVPDGKVFNFPEVVLGVFFPDDPNTLDECRLDGCLQLRANSQCGVPVCNDFVQDTCSEICQRNDCLSSVLVENSLIVSDTCLGNIGDECEIPCAEGYTQVGPHTCFEFNGLFFGGRCEECPEVGSAIVEGTECNRELEGGVCTYQYCCNRTVAACYRGSFNLFVQTHECCQDPTPTPTPTPFFCGGRTFCIEEQRNTQEELESLGLRGLLNAILAISSIVACCGSCFYCLRGNTKPVELQKLNNKSKTKKQESLLVRLRRSAGVGSDADSDSFSSDEADYEDA